MDDQNQRDQEWKKLMGAAFPPLKNANADIFVSKIMARIDEETHADSGFKFSWKVPALAFGLSTAAFFLLIQPQASDLTTESLLLMDGSEKSVVGEYLQTEELLTYAPEEQ